MDWNGLPSSGELYPLQRLHYSRSRNERSDPQLGNENLKTHTNFQRRFIINIKQPPVIPSATALDLPSYLQEFRKPTL